MTRSCGLRSESESCKNYEMNKVQKIARADTIKGRKETATVLTTEPATSVRHHATGIVIDAGVVAEIDTSTNLLIVGKEEVEVEVEAMSRIEIIAGIEMGESRSIGGPDRDNIMKSLSKSAENTILLFSTL